MNAPDCEKIRNMSPPVYNVDTTDFIPDDFDRTKNVILIWASGSALRFNGETKQLLPINGEAILLRTIRLLKTYTSNKDNIVVITNKKDIKQELQKIGCYYYTPENHKWLTDTLLSTESLWSNKRTICLYADVFYSFDTLNKIVSYDDKGLMFFSRKGEILGFSFTPRKAAFVKEKCAHVSKEADAGRAKTKGKGWCLFRACSGRALSERNFESDIMVKFGDRSTDVDSPTAYDKKIRTGFFNHSSFQDPQDKYKEGITAITCTGDRRACFDLCYRYMSRQTLKPDQWIVVDDGQIPIDLEKYPLITDYIRRQKTGRRPKHTLARNLREAVKIIHHKKCVIFEDDDWYHKDYIRLMGDVLEREDLVGQKVVIEFNVALKRYRVKRNKAHSSLCCTAFNYALYNHLKIIVNANDSFLVDRQLWNSFFGCKKLLNNQTPYLVVGIKGSQGRRGMSRGWKLRFLKHADETGRHLKSKIGDDFAFYKKYYEKIDTDKWDDVL